MSDSLDAENLGLLMELRPDEMVLTGKWVIQDGRVVGDDVCRRIEWLVQFRLQRLATDSTGWDTLYRDPHDGRLWEHTYPESGMHGGGPPQLSLVASETAGAKYRLDSV